MWTSQVKCMKLCININLIYNVINFIYRASMINAVEAAVKRSNELASTIK